MNCFSETVLGLYDFSDETTIFPRAHLISENLALTEIHEGAHKHLCDSTTFGTLQLLLASLSRFRHLPQQYSDRFSRLLQLTIQASWSLHEGAATAAEASAVLAGGRADYDDFRAGLDESYRSALDPFEVVLLNAEIPRFALLHVVTGIAQCALSTRILEDLEHLPAISGVMGSHYFARVENSPNARAARLFALLQSRKVQERLIRAVRYVVQKRFLLADPVGESYDALAVEQKVRIDDAIVAATISLVKRNSGLEVTGIGPRYRIEKRLKLLRSWANVLRAEGIILPEFRKSRNATFSERSDRALDISYVQEAQRPDILAMSYSPPLMRALADRQLYVSCGYNPSDQPIRIAENSPAEIEPGGLYMLMRGASVGTIRGEPTIAFLGPAALLPRASVVGVHDDADLRRRPLGVLVSAADVASALDTLAEVAAIVQTPQWCRVALLTRLDYSLERMARPVIITPASSTLSSWTDTISNCGDDSPELVMSIAPSGTPFLTLVTNGGRYAYTRATSLSVSTALAERHSDWLRQGQVDEVFGERYGHKWTRRLSIALAHLARYGW